MHHTLPKFMDEFNWLIAKKMPIFSFSQLRTQNVFHTTFIPEGVNSRTKVTSVSLHDCYIAITFDNF